jgi:large repetitive protein
MRASRLTTRLLVGAGAAAGLVLAWGSAAAADHQAGNPPPKRPVITSAPASPGTDSTPTWAWTDPDGQANTCELRLGGTTVFGPAACTSPITYDLTGQPYGTYTFLVENVDAWSTSTYTRFPAAPVITSAPTSPDNDATPTWSFTLPAGTTGSCSVLQGATVVEGPTACAGSYTAALTADGAYTFRVVAVGNSLTSAPDTSAYTFDSTLPPAAAITGSPSSPSADDTPAWTFTTSGDTASTLCSLSGVAALAPCTSPATYDVTSQPSGTYTFSVITVDAAGNQSAPATSSYVRLAPPVITSSPTSPGNDPTPTWAYTVAGGAGAECTLRLGATVVDGPVACGSSYTPTLTTDGTYTFEVVAVDGGSGVRSAPETSTYAFDSTPPAVPTLTGFPSSPSDDDTPTWTFTTSGDTASVLCSVSGGVATSDPCTSPATYDLSGQPAGTYTFSVVAVDALGNQSAPASLSFVRLSAPVITGEPVSPGNDATPTWTFTVPGGAGAECTLRLGATVVDGPVACGTSYTPSLAADGTYTFEVVAVDGGSGLRSAADTSTYTFDGTAPLAPAITGSPATPDADDSPTWTFTVSGDTVSTLCSLSGVAALAPCTSPATYDVAGLPAGTYTFSVVAIDAVGNQSAPATSSYVRLGPPVITGQPVSPDNDATPTWTFTVPGGAGAECTLRLGATVVDGPVACGTSYTAPTLAADGTYTFEVVSVDAGSGVRSTPDTSTYTFDSTAPTIPTITGSPAPPDDDDTPTWTFTVAGDTASTLCSLSGVAALAPCTSPATYDLTGLPAGTYTFSVVAVDALGNQSAPATSSFVRLSPPVITGQPVSPGNDATPTWTFTVSGGAGAECTLRLGATVVDGPVACVTSYTAPALATDGTYTFEVVAVDAGSGVRSAPDTSTYTFDSTAPNIPVITGSPATPDDDDTPTWTFTVSGDTVSTLCALSGVAAMTPCTSPATYDLTGLPAGTYTFSVVAVDALGNQSAPATSSFVRLAAPAVTGEPATPGNDPTPTWTYTVAGGAGAECTLRLGATVVDGPVACGTSYTPTLVTDGTYTFEVVAVDLASGVRSAPDTSTYTFDSTPPPAPTLTGFPPSPTTEDSPAFSFTTGGDTVSTTCSITGGATAPCTSPVSFDLTGQPAGFYTVTITAIDAAGNQNPTVFVLERIVPPPPPTITGGPVTPGNDATPTWTFDLPVGTTGDCTVLQGATVVEGPVGCVGSFTAAALPADGTYTFRVIAVDVVTGLVSTPVTSSYDFDGTGPAAPTITSGPPSPVYEDFPTWAFTVSGDTVTALCSVVSGATVIVAEAPCTSPATFDLTAQPDGDYTFVVRGVDAVGNIGPADTSTYTLDRTPPTPTITASPTSPANDTTPTWSFTTPAGTVTECSLLLGAIVVAGPVACTGSQTFTVSADGTYTFQVVAVYPAISRVGAPATSTYEFDGTPPEAPAFTATPTSPAANLTPRWTYTTPVDAVRIECTLTFAGTAIIGPGTCPGSFQPNLRNQPDGVYTLTVVAVDAVGNRSPGAVSTYTLDLTPPASPVVTGGPSGLTANPLPGWTFTTAPGTTTTCALTLGSAVIAPSAPCDGSASYDLGAQPDGTYVFTVVARDSAGNTSAPRTVSITLDRTAPVAPTIQNGPSGTSSDDTPTWRFVPPSGSTTQCSILRGATVILGPVACGSPASFDLTAEPDGVYTFAVQAIDAVGNIGPPATSSYTLNTGRVAPPEPRPNPPNPPTPAPTPLPPVDPGSVVIRDPGIDDSRIPRPAPVPGPVVPAPDGGPTTTTTIDPGPPAPPAGIITQAGRVVTEASRRAAFPLLLLGLVFLFLVIQNRIDRRDPKLAEAPVHAGDELEFGPPPSRRGRQ